MKRSSEPLFWALFGAGGMLSALIGPVVILITGILVPLGFLLPADTMRYARVLAFVQHPVGALGVFVVIALFLFHGCHRLLHSLHDIGVHVGRWGAWLFYGFALIVSLVAAGLLLSIGLAPRASPTAAGDQAASVSVVEHRANRDRNAGVRVQFPRRCQGTSCTMQRDVSNVIPVGTGATSLAATSPARSPQGPSR